MVSRTSPLCLRVEAENHPARQYLYGWLSVPEREVIPGDPDGAVRPTSLAHSEPKCPSCCRRHRNLRPFFSRSGLRSDDTHKALRYVVSRILRFRCHAQEPQQSSGSPVDWRSIAHSHVGLVKRHLGEHGEVRSVGRSRQALQWITAAIDRILQHGHE